MIEMRGAPVAKTITESCKEKIERLKDKGVVPTLAIIRVGCKSDDESYERGAEKRFVSAGAQVEKFLLDEQATQQDLENLIKKVNSDEKIHGILLFRPLPRHMDEEKIKRLISIEKDVDGMSFAGSGTYAPCTPAAVIEILDYYGIDVTGKKVTVIGRSSVVGMPLAIMLIQRNATVTVCHTKTKDIQEECRRADIVVSAAGKAKIIGEDYFSKGQIIIDVGINFADGEMCGDVDFEAAKKYAAAITPVPGGVGAVTTSVILKHTVNSAEIKA